jgi:hypothetical protein
MRIIKFFAALAILIFLACQAHGQYHADSVGLLSLNESNYSYTYGVVNIPAQPHPFLILGGSLKKNGVLYGDWSAESPERERAYAWIQGWTQVQHTTQLLKRWPAMTDSVSLPWQFLYPQGFPVALDFNALTGKAIYGIDTTIKLDMTILYFKE